MKQNKRKFVWLTETLTGTFVKEVRINGKIHEIIQCDENGTKYPILKSGVKILK